MDRVTEHVVAKRAGRRKPRPLHLGGRPAGIGPTIIVASVPDPYNPGCFETVRKNARVHPLDHLHARGRISDAQKASGDRFLRLCEQAAVGGFRAIDYTSVRVDVSRVDRGLPDSAMRAAKEFAAIRADIGRRQFELLFAVIGERRFVADLVPAGSDRRIVAHLHDSLSDALTDVGDYFGVAAGRARAPIRFSRAAEGAAL